MDNLRAEIREIFPDARPRRVAAEFEDLDVFQGVIHKSPVAPIGSTPGVETPFLMPVNVTAKELAEKVHFRGTAVAQALLPVLCFLLVSHQRTANPAQGLGVKSGCATDFFRRL